MNVKAMIVGTVFLFPMANMGLGAVHLKERAPVRIEAARDLRRENNWVDLVQKVVSNHRELAREPLLDKLLTQSNYSVLDQCH